MSIKVSEVNNVQQVDVKTPVQKADDSFKSMLVSNIEEKELKNKLSSLMEDITSYLVKYYYDSMRNLPDFYRKFVYNESELYEDDDYTSIEYWFNVCKLFIFNSLHTYIFKSD